MPIVVITKDEFISLGTGFIISPIGILVTAKHVISDFIKESEFVKPVYAIFISDKKHEHDENLTIGGHVRIRQAFIRDDLDIAYCLLQTMVDQKNNVPLNYPSLMVSAEMPKIGENILGFGYHSCKGRCARDPKSNRITIDYDQKSSFSTGNVIENHFPERDKYMLNFPCFRTDARFDGGMSGGPVFNESGHVSGVVCSGIEDREDYISYCSTLWPSFDMLVLVKYKTDETEKQVYIYDLIKQDIIKADDAFKNIGLVVENGARTISLNKK